MGRIRFKPTHGSRLARVRRKNRVGMAIVVLAAVLMLKHVLFGQPMRLEGDSLSPAVRDGDFIYVQYGRGAPGEIVVVEHDELRVLRRLVGLEGDRVENLDMARFSVANINPGFILVQHDTDWLVHWQRPHLNVGLHIMHNDPPMKPVSHVKRVALNANGDTSRGLHFKNLRSSKKSYITLRLSQDTGVLCYYRL